MADIKGIAVNGNIIKSDSGSSSSSEGLFTIPSTISANQAQFDININWVSQKKEKLQVDVLLLKTGSDSRAYFVNSSSSYIVSNTEDKITFKGEQGREFDNYYLVLFSSSTTQKLCKITIKLSGITTEVCCFPESTLVDTPDGLRFIEDMKAGDAIYSYNLETNEVVKDVIKSNFPASIKTHYYKATLDDNTEINATEFHRFYDWATKDWIKFGDYKVGDKIYTAEKQEKTVINIEQINEETPCYDLDVLNNDNYFIVTGQTNKYLVHNANGDNCGDAN